MKTFIRMINIAINLVKKIALKTVTKKRIKYYFNNNNVIKINFGCGINSLEGWLNCDIDPQPGICYIDCTDGLPFPNDSTDYIFSEHMIEHLELQHIENFIKECYRILKIGGTVRLVTPDLDFFLSMINQPHTEEAELYIDYFRKKKSDKFPADPVRTLNSIINEHGHKFIMNESFLTKVLLDCGFVNIRQYSAGESDISLLRGIEGHGLVIGEDINKIESLVIEANKR